MPDTKTQTTTPEQPRPLVTLEQVRTTLRAVFDAYQAKSKFIDSLPTALHGVYLETPAADYEETLLTAYLDLCGGKEDPLRVELEYFLESVMYSHKAAGEAKGVVIIDGQTYEFTNVDEFVDYLSKTIYA